MEAKIDLLKINNISTFKKGNFLNHVLFKLKWNPTLNEYEQIGKSIMFENQPETKVDLKEDRSDRKTWYAATGKVAGQPGQLKGIDITFTNIMFSANEMRKLKGLKQLVGGGTIETSNVICDTLYVEQFDVENIGSCDTTFGQTYERIQLFGTTLDAFDLTFENSEGEGAKDNPLENANRAEGLTKGKYKNIISYVKQVEENSPEFLDGIYNLEFPSLPEVTPSAINATGATITVKNLIPNTDGKTRIIITDKFNVEITPAITPTTPTNNISIFTITGLTATTKYYVWEVEEIEGQTTTYIKSSFLTTFKTIATTK